MKGVTTAATVFFNVVGAAKMIFVNFSEPENTLAAAPPPPPPGVGGGARGRPAPRPPARAPAFFLAQGFAPAPPGVETDALLGGCLDCPQYRHGCEPQALTKRLEEAGDRRP